MTLLSAFEDFMSRTLEAIPGYPGRLLYLVGLRERGGEYKHWGLEQIYGRNSAEDAIRRAHRTTVTNLAQTPLKALFDQAKQSAEYLQIPLDGVLRELLNAGEEMLPAERIGITQRHLDSIFSTLSRLSNSSKAAH